jgi:hypothetical protein
LAVALVAAADAATVAVVPAGLPTAIDLVFLVLAASAASVAAAVAIWALAARVLDLAREPA